MLATVQKDDFEKVAAVSPYFVGRWGYYSEALRLAAELEPQNVLELGCMSFPLFKGQDTMDVAVSMKPTLLHDASVTPWPINDKRYDLFMALQVWEHLGNQQSQAFKEVQRVSNKAIISVPLQWSCSDPNDMHHGLTLETFDRWFHPVTPMKVVIMPPWGCKRAIYVFDFNQQQRSI
ncbi:MAG: hypothetical protein EBU46_00565 [Nitrosomonadaceae bacterium]|nr:hypothetical protein [Nitrosomonadaceae bacterium]